MELQSEFRLKGKVIAFDLETTGTDIASDRIVQIALVKFEDGNKEEKDLILNPTIPIPREATEVHGISNEDVKDKYKFSQIAKSLNEYFEGADIMGYNSDRFDIPLLVNEFKRCGIDFNLEGRDYIDVLKLERLVKRNDLSSVYKRYTGEDLEGAHNALNDVYACIEVFNRQMNAYDIPETTKDIDDFIQGENKRVDFNGYIVQKDGEYLFNFGKHKGERIKSQVNYADWMLNGDFPRETKMKLSAIIHNKI